MKIKLTQMQRKTVKNLENKLLADGLGLTVKKLTDEKIKAKTNSAVLSLAKRYENINDKKEESTTKKPDSKPKAKPKAKDKPKPKGKSKAKDKPKPKDKLKEKCKPKAKITKK